MGPDYKLSVFSIKENVKVISTWQNVTRKFELQLNENRRYSIWNTNNSNSNELSAIFQGSLSYNVISGFVFFKSDIILFILFFLFFYLTYRDFGYMSWLSIFVFLWDL